MFLGPPPAICPAERIPDTEMETDIEMAEQQTACTLRASDGEGREGK